MSFRKRAVLFWQHRLSRSPRGYFCCEYTGESYRPIGSRLSLRVLFLNFDSGPLAKEEPELMVPFRYYPFHFQNRLHGNTDSMERLRTMIKQIYVEKEERAPGYRTAVKSLLMTICVELLRMSKEEISNTTWLDGMRNYEHIRPVFAIYGRALPDGNQLIPISFVISHQRVAFIKIDIGSNRQKV